MGHVQTFSELFLFSTMPYIQTPHDALYTDVWLGSGHVDDAGLRRAVQAQPDHRGEAGVLEGGRHALLIRQLLVNGLF